MTKFKYMRNDYPELSIKLLHMKIFLNFYEDRVEAENTLDMSAITDLDKVILDADELKIDKVEWIDPEKNENHQLEFNFDKKKKKLEIKPPKTIKADEKFTIRTSTVCRASDTILEGIYTDTTPKGAPQQFMSQCEHWGFQRIAPVIDDPLAKCTMETTIEADAQYTHLISNGNISKEKNPDGKPVLKGDSGRKMITYINDIPMAPYLFIAAVGTWDELVDYAKYNNGKKVRLEYLVPPGMADNAQIPMEILKKSVIWIKEKQDYEYNRDVYRTITMNKSNFGGMENVGNTTIVTDSALVDEHTLDRGLVYVYGVIAHEFEHNQCGSDTTMKSPFDMWINEAYTVDVERQFLSSQFHPVYVRLNNVESIRDPLLGPLAIEDGGQAAPIAREGFDHPDDIVDGLTYVKSAEVIRMLRLIIGKEAFRKAKTIYFDRYMNSNADADQFFGCFEEAYGRSLEEFKRQWILNPGYPKVMAETVYDKGKKTYTIRFTHKKGIFTLPIDLALVDKNGKDIMDTAKIFHLEKDRDEIVFENIEDGDVAFASINRDYSFYGVFEHKNVSREELILQARLDSNLFNRVEAWKRLTDIERIKLLKDPEADIDSSWVELYGKNLKDNRIPNVIKARMLAIGETPLDREYATWYPELVLAKEKLSKKINKEFKDELIKQFNALDTYSEEKLEDGIMDRMLKSLLLHIIAVDDSSQVHNLIIFHLKRATTAQDRITALIAMNKSSYPDSKRILEAYYNRWKDDLSGYANYLRIIGYREKDDVFDMIAKEKERAGFDINQPTFTRALLFPLVFNTKMMWSEKGLEWVKTTIIEFSSINTVIASRILNLFQHVRLLKSGLKEKVKAHLKTIAESISNENNPTINNQANAYLNSAK